MNGHTMNWRIAKASIIGSGHIGANMPCQDSHYVMQIGDTLIAAVSDGLGSAAHSEIGSKIASEQAVTHIANYFDSLKPPEKRLQWWPFSDKPEPKTQPQQDTLETVCRTAFTVARDAVGVRATADSKELRDFACTLLVAVVTPNDWVVMHIGDGAVVGIFEDETTRTLSTPDNGEFINVTMPLTSADYLTHLRFNHKAEALRGVALMSDGVQPMCINYKTGEAYDGFFRPIIQWLRTLDLVATDVSMQKLLDTPRFRQKSDDDMTLVLALRES
jgi:serine/threonine protein phosphatase PrpC